MASDALPEAGQGPRGQRTILLVEDEAANVQLFRAVMRRAGEPLVRDARLLEAGTLAEARRLVASERIDLVLLDVRLPDGVGLDLARELREDPGRPAVMILSASVLPSEVERARAVGVDEFVPKPYRPMELVERIARLIESRTAPG
jgi:CheY-like chemotaxis protein